MTNKVTAKFIEPKKFIIWLGFLLTFLPVGCVLLMLVSCLYI
ncbi:hypothetical protein THIOSC15_370004 [uncultured Thiomicrorhabdus sp.]